MILTRRSVNEGMMGKVLEFPNRIDCRVIISAEDVTKKGLLAALRSRGCPIDDPSYEFITAFDMDTMGHIVTWRKK